MERISKLPLRTRPQITQITDPVKEEKRKLTYGDLPSKYEVMIETNSFIRAQFVNQLIATADCLLHSVLESEDINRLIVYSVDDEKENKKIAEHFGLLRPNFSPTILIHKMDIPLSCEIAAKVSFHKKYVIALNKYFISCKLNSTHWIDLDPGHSLNIPLSPFPHDHLHYAYAILAAYSIIEELQLEIRANQRNPTFLPNGAWNPLVKADLEGRLIKAGIVINDPIPWNVRGPIKTLEKRRPPKAIGKAPWAYGFVRDCEVNLIDAISDLSWIRSKISAHKVDEDIKKLSVYDVANAQHLARRIILESLGFWRKLKGD
jgi:hypothetical protein